MKNRVGFLGKVGAFVTTLILPVLLSPGQAEAAEKGLMVEVPSNSRYCNISVYETDYYIGQKNLCTQGEGVNLAPGWHHIQGVTVSVGSTVSVDYIYYGGRGDTGATVTVLNDNNGNFWYKYKKTGSF